MLAKSCHTASLETISAAASPPIDDSSTGYWRSEQSKELAVGSCCRANPALAMYHRLGWARTNSCNPYIAAIPAMEATAKTGRCRAGLSRLPRHGVLRRPSGCWDGVVIHLKHGTNVLLAAAAWHPPCHRGSCDLGNSRSTFHNWPIGKSRMATTDMDPCRQRRRRRTASTASSKVTP